VAAATIGGLGMPVTIIQMLWLNLLIVSIPALVLAIEPVNEADFMPPSEPMNVEEDEQKPVRFRPQKAKTEAAAKAHTHEPLSATHLFLVAYWAILMSMAALGAYFLCAMALKLPATTAGTAAFCTLALAQTLNLFNVQALNAGENRRAFMRELTSTPITWLVIGVALVLQAVAVYLPGVNTLMGAVPLPPLAAALPALLGGGVILFSLKTMKV
jgi:magnesium-transporting ATPase (P-type)